MGTAMILVTGGTGFIGRHLVRRLVEQGQRVRVLSRRPAPTDGELFIGNILHPGSVEEALSEVDVVYHLAALVDHFASQTELYQTNVLGTAHVIRAALKQGVSRLIHCSTVSAEKGGGRPPMDSPKSRRKPNCRFWASAFPGS